MSERVLPEGWVVTTLGQVVEYGKAEKATREQVDDDTWVLELEDIEKSSSRVIQRLSFSERQFKSTKNRFKKGDVLYGKLRPYLDKVVIAERDGVCTTEIVPLDARAHLDNRYLFYWLKSLDFLAYVNEVGYGVNMPRLGTKEGKSAPFVLAPRAEQVVIADKLDEILAQVSNLKARLDAIPAILKRFRLSVLAAAMSGELTNYWRFLSAESSKGDLRKELYWSKGGVKKVESTSHHDLVMKLIPSDWEIIDFNSLYKFIDYRGKTPRKSSHGKRLYTAKNIKMGYLSNDPVEFISEHDYGEWMVRGFTKFGDIFFVTEGHTMGCCALNAVGSDIALAQRTITLQPYGELNTKFHYYYILSHVFQKLVFLNSTGSAAIGIKAAKFRGLPVPFPSYEEQNEIVLRVDELFAFADQIEQQVKNAQARVNKLTQSILAKAFRGELTAEWRAANPELISGELSARALLERIKVEAAKQKPVGKGKIRKQKQANFSV